MSKEKSKGESHFFEGSIESVRPRAIARAKELVQMLESGEYHFFLAVAVNEDGYVAIGTQVAGEPWTTRMLLAIAGLLERFAYSKAQMDDPRKEGETVQ